MSSKFNRKTRNALLGIFILMIAVLIGLLLVRQDQNFRNKAKTVNEKVLICHKNKSQGTTVEMYVDPDELSSYFYQGDTLGNCGI